MNTGSLIRDARLAAGLTQAELAARSATSQATLSAYERDRKVPSASTLARLLAAAGRRLSTQPATRPVVVPTKDDLTERGRILAQVIDLAERMPRRMTELRYPPLIRTVRS